MPKPSASTDGRRRSTAQPSTATNELQGPAVASRAAPDAPRTGPAAPKTPQPSIFVSYSRTDARVAQRLVRALKNAGIKYWIDENELKAGDLLRDRIEIAIGRAEFFLILLSRNSVKSKWVRFEVKTALSHQLKGRERFIIPLTLDDCRVPGFLERLICIDFSNRRKFSENVARLVRSLDLSQEQAATQTIAFPDAATLDRMAKDPELKRTRWFKQYKDMPLVQLCHNAFRLGSYGGQFRRDLALYLEMASNQEGGLYLNNLAALAGFLVDLPRKEPFPTDVLSLMQTLVEDRFIATEYRSFIVSQLLDMLEQVAIRNKRLRFLPDIFQGDTTDPLANRLIMEHFAGKERYLARLWKLASSYYREDIWSYMARASEWSDTPRLSEAAMFDDNLDQIVVRQLPQWSGIRSALSANLSCITILERARIAAEVPATLEVVATFEQLSLAGRREDLDVMLNLLGRIDRVKKTLDTRYYYDLLIHLISSPNVDAIVSTLALNSFVMDFDEFGLNCHDWFPGCIIRKKDVGVFKDMSVARGIIEQLSEFNDSSPPSKSSLYPLHILAKLVTVFDLPPLLATFSLEIGKHATNKHLEMAQRLVHRELTPADVLAYVRASARTLMGTR